MKLIDLKIGFADLEFFDFVLACVAIRGQSGVESVVVPQIAKLTKALIRKWKIPDDRYLRPDPGGGYASYLLYLHPNPQFSIVLETFQPRQNVVIHNHRTWGVIGCIEGRERQTRYRVPPALNSRPIKTARRLNATGSVIRVGPAVNAFHLVECAGDRPSTSLHVYERNIGEIRRHYWDEDSHRYVEFESGYSNAAAGLEPYLTRLI